MKKIGATIALMTAGAVAICLSGPGLVGAEPPPAQQICEEQDGSPERLEECLREAAKGEREEREEERESGKRQEPERGPKPNGGPTPTAPVNDRLKRSFPKSHNRFVNCPGNNRVTTATGAEGIACEFRFVIHHAVARGFATVEPDSEAWETARWSLVGFYPGRPQPKVARRCSLGGLAGLSQEAVQLIVAGDSCVEARYIARSIGSRAYSSSSLRIPHRFTEGEYQTNTLGFVTSRFQCRGSVHVLQGNENPYGHEIAHCRTRFGDRIAYVFNQFS